MILVALPLAADWKASRDLSLMTWSLGEASFSSFRESAMAWFTFRIAAASASAAMIRACFSASARRIRDSFSPSATRIWLRFSPSALRIASRRSRSAFICFSIAS